MAYPFEILDVFAETKLAGNQLAVVHDAADLSTEQMQAIALETNFSETTFVVHTEPGRATVRIFTPEFELPFAGHPSLGTAWALTEGVGSIVLDLGIGPVTVSFEDGLGWITVPEVSFLGAMDSKQAAAVLGLAEADIDAQMPVEIVQAGPTFVLIPITNLDALKRARVQPDIHADLKKRDLNGLFLFSSEGYSKQVNYATRMFFDAAGLREDPATGSANAAFSAYLKKHRGEIGEVLVDQGVEINRPSRIYLRVAETLQVGGRVERVVQGELQV